jgi:hypothetical protein
VGTGKVMEGREKEGIRKERREERKSITEKISEESERTGGVTIRTVEEERIGVMGRKMFEILIARCAVVL